MKKFDRVKAVVSLDAIAHNFEEMKKNIAEGTNKVIVTIIEPKQLGIKCLNKILVFDAPNVLAAKTNSCCFN